MGLGAFANKFISELSTGTRRIVDLACTLAHEPKRAPVRRAVVGHRAARDRGARPAARRHPRRDRRGARSSSSTTCRSSPRSPTASSRSTSAASSPTGRPTRSSRTRASSSRTSAATSPRSNVRRAPSRSVDPRAKPKRNESARRALGLPMKRLPGALASCSSRPRAVDGRATETADGGADPLGRRRRRGRTASTARSSRTSRPSRRVRPGDVGRLPLDLDRRTAHRDDGNAGRSRARGRQEAGPPEAADVDARHVSLPPRERRATVLPREGSAADATSASPVRRRSKPDVQRTQTVLLERLPPRGRECSASRSPTTSSRARTASSAASTGRGCPGRSASSPRRRHPLARRGRRRSEEKLRGIRRRHASRTTPGRTSRSIAHEPDGSRGRRSRRSRRTTAVVKVLEFVPFTLKARDERRGRAGACSAPTRSPSTPRTTRSRPAIRSWRTGETELKADAVNENRSREPPTGAPKKT